MNHLFPPLLPKDDLRGPVLAFAAHPDDEIMGCGGMLAWHAQRGDAVTVAHLTDGAAGDPDAAHEDIRATRTAEGREALSRLGVSDLRPCGLPDGELPEHLDAACQQMRALIAEVQPKTVYSFFFTEAHRDHRAVAHATARCHDALDADCRVLLYGVNQEVPGATMFELGAFMDQKQHALQAFASQLAYNDFAERILHRDHAATINVEDPTVNYAECFVDLRPAELPRACALADELIRFLLRDES